MAKSTPMPAAALAFEIGDVRALVRRADRADAQRLLERIAAQVLPILTKRRFRVRRLQEFFPKNANLLGMNVNRGYTIYIRLRPQSRPTTFLPYEALLETMLHELTHMVHGPHNQAFYKYLDGLKEELETLMMRGLLGREGAVFQDAGVGHSIQTHATSIPVRFPNDNRAAAAAAARRAKYHALLGGTTSQRLGSGARAASPNRELTPSELRRRALAAAERRRRDNLACDLMATVTERIEILGIDDSEDEDESAVQRREQSATAVSSRANETSPIVICVDDDDTAAEVETDSSTRQIPHSPVVSNIIDLVDDECVSNEVSIDGDTSMGTMDEEAGVIDLTND